MEEIMERAKKMAEEAEVFTISSEETSVQFETNRLKHLQTRQSTTVALRIIRQGKIGYATTTRLDDIHELVNNAVETAQFGMPAMFQLPVVSIYPDVAVFDPAVESVPVEMMIELGKKLISITTHHTPNIICEAGLSRVMVSGGMLYSRGG